ncbi:MAG: hypothetical protein NTW50_04845 [Candidatus Berkelbacteria bacterium]|nr:hypothetical protein [Candidatus Berkelbacteria bacterium]
MAIQLSQKAVVLLVLSSETIRAFRTDIRDWLMVGINPISGFNLSDQKKVEEILEILSRADLDIKKEESISSQVRSDLISIYSTFVWMAASHRDDSIRADFFQFAQKAIELASM